MKKLWLDRGGTGKGKIRTRKGRGRKEEEEEEREPPPLLPTHPSTKLTNAHTHHWLITHDSLHSPAGAEACSNSHTWAQHNTG